jgi:hypothetical protein
MDQSPYLEYKDALLRKRGEILAQGGGVKPLTTSAETNSRQGRVRATWPTRRAATTKSTSS